MVKDTSPLVYWIDKGFEMELRPWIPTAFQKKMKQLEKSRVKSFITMGVVIGLIVLYFVILA